MNQRTFLDTVNAMGFQRTFETIMGYAVHQDGRYGYYGNRDQPWRPSAKRDGWPAVFDSWTVEHMESNDLSGGHTVCLTYRAGSFGDYTLHPNKLVFHARAANLPVPDNFAQLTTYNLDAFSTDAFPTLYDAAGNPVSRSNCEQSDARKATLIVIPRLNQVLCATAIEWYQSFNAVPKITFRPITEAIVDDSAKRARPVTDAMAQLGTYYKMLATLNPDCTESRKRGYKDSDELVVNIIGKMLEGMPMLDAIGVCAPLQDPEDIAGNVLEGIYFADRETVRGAKFGISDYKKATALLKHGKMASPNPILRRKIMLELYGRHVDHRVLYLTDPTNRNTSTD
jgi:hypothetical protein